MGAKWFLMFLSGFCCQGRICLDSAPCAQDKGKVIQRVSFYFLCFETQQDSIQPKSLKSWKRWRPGHRLLITQLKTKHFNTSRVQLIGQLLCMCKTFFSSKSSKFWMRLICWWHPGKGQMLSKDQKGLFDFAWSVSQPIQICLFRVGSKFRKWAAVSVKCL